MSFQKAINRRLDFGINANNEAIPSKSSGTTLGFGENPGMIKRTIEHVSPSDSNANVDTSVSIGSPVQKAPRRSPQPRRSPRLVLKALKGVLVKRRNLSGIMAELGNILRLKIVGSVVNFICPVDESFN